MRSFFPQGCALRAVQIFVPFFLAFNAYAAAVVVGVSDGDTLTLLNGNVEVKVRLANIDAPEKRQPFGERSKRALSDLCFGKQASYVVQTRDRYGRAVATVSCAGVDAGRAQIGAGMAWVYTKYNQDVRLPLVEEAARKSGRGLWSDRNPVAPWDFRRSRRTGFLVPHERDTRIK